MDFPKCFINAGSKFCTLTEQVPAPYFRRKFTATGEVKTAKLLICGLGFYQLHINGEDITKGYLAPYRSNHDHYIYYDEYEISRLLSEGENVIACVLGNGMQNSFGAFVWDVDKAAWRGAPQVAFSVVIEYRNGEKHTILSDTETLTAPSPILFDDLHFGEYYDARLEIPGWDKPEFDDSGWKNAELAPVPRGEARICEAEPIVLRQEVKPVSITECDGGYIYDFGVNSAGVCRLTINGTAGQKVLLQHFEMLKDGKPYFANIRFHAEDRFQEDEYYCSGNGTEIHVPSFTYHGFRYVYVTGITSEQATPELLTYLMINSDIKCIGSFSCDDPVINRLQEATVQSDLSNFHYFPTDCPQREKNGWTADAALSCEQMLLNLTPEKSYREWMHNIYKALKDNGQLPGIIPSGGWGYHWGNGPAWDNVIVYLPYYTYIYRGDRQIISDAAIPLMRYLTYINSRADERGLIAIGLGDWCQPGRDPNKYLTPLVVTDSILTVDIAQKAAFIFETLGMVAEKNYALAVAGHVTVAFREHLINRETMTVEGDTQTAQALALYYGMFTEEEKPRALQHLIELIDEADGHMDTGVLGGRVIFRLLAENGYADLAFNMIARPDYPSYGNWIKRGATTLWETFMPEGAKIDSLNHHFWGDISAWFYRYLGGIQVNPTGKDLHNMLIAPCFVSKLSHVKASHCTPDGETIVEWTRRGNSVELRISVPAEVQGTTKVPAGWRFENGSMELPLKTGIYTAIQN